MNQDLAVLLSMHHYKKKTSAGKTSNFPVIAPQQMAVILNYNCLHCLLILTLKYTKDIVPNTR